MAKINRKPIYPVKENPILSDYFIGSDNATYSKKTVNFEMEKVADLFFAYFAEQLQIIQSRITALGTITRSGNIFTFSTGFEWVINGNPHANTQQIQIEILEADAGFKRIDIAVLTNQNEILKVEGEPSAGVAIQPLVPANTILLTTWDVNGAVISEPTEPVIGSFVTKQSYVDVETQITGGSQLLQFHPLGNNTYRLKNASLSSVSGFSMQDIDAFIAAQGTDEDVEFPYNGKWFVLINETGRDVRLNNDDAVEYPFILPNSQSLLLKDKQKLIIRYKQSAASTGAIKGTFELITGDIVNLVRNFTDPNQFDAATTQAIVDYIAPLIPNGLVDGGFVVWSGTGFIYDVSQTIIKLSGQIYTLGADQVTLDAPDATFNRIDTVYADASGYGVITGTPSADPIIPQVDNITQVALTSIIVTAGAASGGATVTGENIYQENTEWTGSYTGPGTANFDSLDFPFAGTKAIETTNISNNSSIIMDKGTDFTYSDFETISFRVRLKSTMGGAQSNKRGLVLRILDAANNQIGTAIVVQFDKTLVGEYQLIAVPINNMIGASTTARKVSLTYTGFSNQTLQGFFVDDWKLQGGITQPAPVVEQKPPVHKSYLTQAAMLAAQAEQLQDFIYYDGTSHWQKKATSTGVIGDYISFVTTPTEEQIIGNVQVLSNVTGTLDIDLSVASYFIINLTGGTTITFTNPPADNKTFVRTFKFIAPAQESYTLPAYVVALDGGAPDPTKTNFVTINFARVGSTLEGTASYSTIG